MLNRLKNKDRHENNVIAAMCHNATKGIRQMSRASGTTRDAPPVRKAVLVKMAPAEAGKCRAGDVYQVPGIGVIKREYETLTPNGNALAGRWAFRDEGGELLDYDKYINDLASRHHIDLYSESE